MRTRPARRQVVALGALTLLLALALPASAQTRSASDAAGAWPGARNPNLANMGAMGMGGSTVPRVNLTESNAQRALDAFLEIRNKYGKQKMQKPSALGASAEGMLASREVASIVSKFGFSEPKTWQETLVNVALAYGFLKDGDKLADFDQSMAEMENANIPPEVRAQLMASINSMRPSESNLAAVKALMADPAYRKKLEDFESN